MRTRPGLVIGCVLALLTIGAVPALARPNVAHGAQGTVTLDSDNADLDTFQFVDDAHQNQTHKDGSDFFAFAEHRHPAKVTGPEGTASAFVSEAATAETPAQPPFPVTPLNDIADSGRATAETTATGNGPAVPVVDSGGSFDADFEVTGASVPAFFSGALLTANDDADSCSSVTVDLTGPSGFARHFAAFTGDCTAATPHHMAFAESDVLAAGEYQLEVEYEADLDDDPGEATSLSGSAFVDTNLSFFPPTAVFHTTLSGSTAKFDATGSSVGDPNRHIAKYEWTFGDGRKATTTTPKVRHRYAATPSRVRKYAVTLKVVDSSGAISPTVRHFVADTVTTAAVHKTARKAKVAGSVRPRRHGKHVVVTLARKRHGAFHTVAKHSVPLNAHSRYATSFSRPAAGRCRITARYPGDATHLASQRVRAFAC
jgi:hypothetical protein